jgi:hypothetical protein
MDPSRDLLQELGSLKSTNRTLKAQIAGETRVREQAQALAARETIRADRAEQAQRDLERALHVARERANKWQAIAASMGVERAA